MSTEKSVLGPFHQTIVEDIFIATNEQMAFIAVQLKRTDIPLKAIDDIILAWDARRKALCWNEEEDLGVPASLVMQKQIAEEKAVKRQNLGPGIELGELQKAMETFLSNSHNQNLSGNGSLISCWHYRLQQQLVEIYRLTARALGNSE